MPLRSLESSREERTTGTEHYVGKHYETLDRRVLSDVAQGKQCSEF